MRKIFFSNLGIRKRGMQEMRTEQDVLCRQLTARYRTRYSIQVAIFSVFEVLLIGLIYLALNSIHWKQESGLHEFLPIFNDFLFLILAICWAAGVLALAFANFRYRAAQAASMGKSLAQIIENPENSIELPADFLEMQSLLQKAQNAIAVSRKNEQEAVRRKNDLIMYLAHDLKTPLTSILGYLTLLHDEREISPQNRQQYLHIALVKARRLEGLIQDFFEIARFNLSEIVLEKSRFDFSRLLEQIADEFQPLLCEKGLQIKIEALKNMEILADAGKLERVIDNLIRNAINYSYENAAITIRAFLGENKLILDIANQGRSIPAHKLGHIFEQFYRADESRSGDGGGAGLGLAIAKAIVERHNGTITAESADDHTIFTITLPLFEMS